MYIFIVLFFLHYLSLSLSLLFPSLLVCLRRSLNDVNVSVAVKQTSRMTSTQKWKMALQNERQKAKCLNIMMLQCCVAVGFFLLLLCFRNCLQIDKDKAASKRFELKKNVINFP